MTDTNHNEEKEALETALNHTAIYRGIRLCTVAITRADDWLAHDDGTVTGPGYTTAVAPSPEVKALIDASLDPAPPVGPPPAPPSPIDPPPVDVPPPPPIDVPPPDDTPALIGQTLTVDLEEIHVGDKFNAVSTLNYSDGSTRPGNYYIRTNNGNVAISKYWLARLTAVATGTVVISNDASGFTSSVSVAVLPAREGGPIDLWPVVATPPPSPAPAPAPAPASRFSRSKLAQVGRRVIYNVFASASGGERFSTVVVDWGDGTEPQSLGIEYTPAQHDFAADGTYTITLTGTAVNGVVSTRADGVTVAQLAEPPEPKITADGVANLTATLEGGIAVDVTLTKGSRVFLRDDMPALGSIVFHGDGRSVNVEAAYEITTADLAGHFKLNASGKALWDDLEVIWAHSRTCPFWVNMPEVNPNADFTKFGKWNPVANAGHADTYVVGARGPMTVMPTMPGMGGAGDREELGGPLRGTDVNYIANPTAANASWVRRKADEACPWPFHCIDSKTQKMLLATDHPHAGFPHYPDDPKDNPILPWTTATPLDCTGSSSHTYPLCTLSTELFGGTDFDREELALWANYTGCLQTRSAYRMADMGIDRAGPIHTGGSMRGTGRTLTLLLYAAALSDHPEQFTRWANAQIDETAAALEKQTGIQIDQRSAGDYGSHHEFAPWQHGMETEALGHAVAFGYANAQAPFDLLATYFIDAVLVGPHEWLTAYTHAWQRSDKTPVAGWAEGVQVQAAYNTTVSAVLACEEGSAALQAAMGAPRNRPGDFVASDPTSSDNYIAQDAGAFARIRDHATDQARAIAAYDKFHQYYRVRAGSKWSVVAFSAPE